MLQDIIAEFQRAPLWAQIGMSFFAFMALVMLFEPSLTRRKFRRRFDAIAEGLGQPLPAARGLPVAFPVSVEGRPFEVRHTQRSSSRGGSYRGPTGFLLITASRLASPRWSMHQVDVSKPEGLGSWLLRKSGAAPDGLMVKEDGLPVRDGWLNPATRAALRRFLDEAPVDGVLWIREGELTFTMQQPWKGLDGPAVRALLQRQGTLTAALDATAGRPEGTAPTTAARA